MFGAHPGLFPPRAVLPSGQAILFAPSDQAFSRVLATLRLSLAEVAATPSLVRDLLSHHIGIVGGGDSTAAVAFDGEVLAFSVDDAPAPLAAVIAAATTGKAMAVVQDSKGMGVAGVAGVVVCNTTSQRQQLLTLDTVLLPATYEPPAPAPAPVAAPALGPDAAPAPAPVPVPWLAPESAFGPDLGPAMAPAMAPGPAEGSSPPPTPFWFPSPVAPASSALAPALAFGATALAAAALV
jgi:hypothetical protein